MRPHVPETGLTPPTARQASSSHSHRFQVTHRPARKDALKKLPLYDSHGIWKKKKEEEKHHITAADWQTSNKTSGGGTDFLHAALTFKSTIKIRPQIASL